MPDASKKGGRFMARPFQIRFSCAMQLMRPPLLFLVLFTLEGFFPIRAAAAEREYDLVVYGGTSGGISAAVQAARMGRSVVLIEPGNHLGGMTTGGLGATDIGNKRAIGGISREFYQRVRKHYADEANWMYEKRADFRGSGQDQKDDAAWTFEPHVAEMIYNQLVQEHRIPVFRQRLDLAKGVRKDGTRRHHNGIRPKLPRQSVHRRDLRRRPDGEVGRLLPRRTRSEQHLWRNPERRAGQTGNPSPVHQED
jgi:hypothetical protein